MNKELKGKFELLLDDCKKSINKAKETGKGFFTDELYAIRVKEIYKMCQQDTEINKLKQVNEHLKSELGYTRNYTGDHIPRID